MTRKDYELIASAITKTKSRITHGGVLDVDTRAAQLRGVRRTAAMLCKLLAEENPAFDQQRFLEACGYGA